MKTKAFYLFAASGLSLGGWLSLGFLLQQRGPGWLVALPIVVWLLLSSLALAAAEVCYRGWIYASLLALGGLPLLPYALSRLSPGSVGFGISFLIYPVAVFVALIFYFGRTLRMRRSRDAEAGVDSQSERRQDEWAGLVPVLSALTLASWGVGQGIFGFGYLGPLSPLATTLLGWLAILAIVLLLVSALVLAARRASRALCIFAAFLTLVALSMPTSVLTRIFPTPLRPPLGLMLIPSAALVVLAWLVYQSLIPTQFNHSQRNSALRIALILGLSALLLPKTLHTLYWITVWDTTYDSLGYLWLLVPVLSMLFSAVALAAALPGWKKLVSLLYLLLVPALIFAVSSRAQRVDFRQLTEARAERVARAIEAYKGREGRYPQDLSQLTPRYALWIPGPILNYGQNWCYEGGEDYYRLGAIYREHWSDPGLSGRAYAFQGTVPDTHGICEEEIAAIQERYPDYGFEVWTGAE
ncbi:MAG: hypothetical protein PVI59_15100 [Anaerolineae bacterium]|jgi:hypothetical protein